MEKKVQGSLEDLCPQAQSHKNFEGGKPPNTLELEEGVKNIFRHLGENVGREGLKDTPKRVLESWKHLYSGYQKSPEDVLTFFEEDQVVSIEQENQIILLKEIDFFSTCEHHLLPFSGKAHIAYIPSGKIVGISKLARIVDIFARRLQVQERIGHQVSEALMEHLDAKAAACFLEASHFCMLARGVEKKASKMVTTSFRGDFLTNSDLKKELFSMVKF